MKLFSALSLALLAGAARAGCPNSCSGHGTCKLGEVCECQPRWQGADCGDRECPYGVSWVTSDETALAPGGASYDNIPSVRGGAFPLDDAFMGSGGRHPYTECSSKGSCDRSSGECQCFEGYTGKGCRRMKCPNDCSGNGMCMTNFEINPSYFSVDPDSQMWDWNKATQCKCDPGYQGLDCSKRTCPVGDDPLTNCDAGTQVSDIQKLTGYATDTLGVALCPTVAAGTTCAGCASTTNPCSYNGGAGLCDGSGNCDQNAAGTADGGSDGYFTLQYTDAYGANYTTRPIFFSSAPESYGTCSDTTRTAYGRCEALYNAAGTSAQVAGVWTSKTAADIESALEGLPNFAIPNVTVSWDTSSCGLACDDNDYTVTFLDDANAGEQELLLCSWTETESQNHAGASPRFAEIGRAHV